MTKNREGHTLPSSLEADMRMHAVCGLGMIGMTGYVRPITSDPSPPACLSIAMDRVRDEQV